MAQPRTTSPTARWGIPLVLPHVLLSLGLLTFAAISERPAPSESVRAVPDIASATTAMPSRRIDRS
ncbi:hypothetical protein [Methylobacterium haplocladii]|uniref:Uncharacterized protein n=1 Tax=Methylobacterium haplocladii TaxID=1176176 RepID=A0A512ILR5_9HYPH|nr:hypothetical protein [Methylobacterium haplocladii]GEO98666.1 hypothetical protein MHA02_10540 [Methylobacterium haplocladii]GJD83933.1 hypothetical protein HPGCJGGD_1807 [Methylobacterium haplocladii]GLS57684.1 hypothetical protein GCM10007887_03400 [Methylobacterium haplocladii]